MMTKKQRIRPTVRRQFAGFTLIELLVIITVMGILASIVYMTILNSRQRISEAALREDLSRSYDQLERGRSQGKPYPLTLSAAKLDKDDDTIYSYQTSDDSFCLSASSSSRPDFSKLHITSEAGSIEEGGC